MKASKLIISLLASLALVIGINYKVKAEEEINPPQLKLTEVGNKKELTKEEYEALNKFIKAKTVTEYNDGLLAVNKEADKESGIYKLALTYVGKYGSCFCIAVDFVEDYYGEDYNIERYEVVNALDAKPGDIIYYANGGLGVQHYAIYLGGSDALQGNFNGITVIGSVYLNRASEPQFRRLIKD